MFLNNLQFSFCRLSKESSEHTKENKIGILPNSSFTQRRRVRVTRSGTLYDLGFQDCYIWRQHVFRSAAVEKHGGKHTAATVFLE